MKYAKFFRNHPVFTSEEFRKFMNGKGRVGERTLESVLAYHIKAGHIVKVRRGLYASAEGVSLFPIASRVVKDAVLAYHTALEFHGYAYSLWRLYLYSSANPTAPFRFRGYDFKGVMFPKALRDAGLETFGVVTEKRQGVDVRVTGLERTLVDVFDRPDLSGGWEEIWRSLETVEFLDLDKVVEYAALLGNATTAAKVGLFLEQHRKMFRVKEPHLRALFGLKPKKPHYMERSLRQAGRFVARWNLIVPEDVLERRWEEVL